MVLTLVEETPDMTLAEIAAHLESEHGVRVSQSTVWRFFHRRGIAFKKRLTPASSNDLTCGYQLGERLGAGVRARYAVRRRWR